MIYVTVGTDTHDFSRLVRKMDEISLKREVIIQIGHTQYIPQHATWFRFEKNDAVDRLFKKADVIVTHAGAGSIIRCLTNGKIPVVVPRLRQFKEHVNDHQLDLARGLARRGKIILVEDVEDLENAIKVRRKKADRHNTEMIRNFEKYLVEYEKTLS